MSPFKSEAYGSDRDAQTRLMQLGAVHKPEVSTGSKWIYWSNKQKAWLTAERRSGQFVINFYRQCPCSG